MQHFHSADQRRRLAINFMNSNIQMIWREMEHACKENECLGIEVHIPSEDYPYPVIMQQGFHGEIPIEPVEEPNCYKFSRKMFSGIKEFSFWLGIKRAYYQSLT